ATAEYDQARNLRRTAELYLSVMTDAESGQRGFLLTGDEQYLVPYKAALAALPNLLYTLAGLAKQIPDQAARVERLNRLTQEKLAELKNTIDIRLTQGPEAALRMVNTDAGVRLMNSIRELGTEITSAQSERMAERTREAAGRSNQVR